MKIYSLFSFVLMLAVAVGSRAFATCCLSSGTSYRLPSGAGQLASISMTPDGNYVAATTGYSGNVVLFSLTDGVLSSGTRYGIPTNPVSSTFSPNGELFAATQVASDSGGQSVVLVQVNSNGTLGSSSSYGGGNWEPLSVAFSPDATLVAVGCRSAVQIYPVYADGTSSNENSIYYTPSGLNGCWATFSPDGKYLVAANSGSNSVTIFPVNSNGTLSDSTFYDLPGSSSGPNSVVFSPNGSYLATANQNSNDATIFNVSAGGVLSGGTSYAVPSGSSPSSVVFSPNGSCLAIADSSSSEITLFTFSGGVLSKTISFQLPANSTGPAVVVFTPDNTYLLSGNSGSNDITIFPVIPCPTTTASSAATGTTTGSSGTTTGSGSGSSTTGSSTTSSYSGSCLTALSDHALPSYPGYSLTYAPNSVVFSPDGSLVATAMSGADTVILFPITGGMLGTGNSYSLPGVDNNPNSIAFSPDGGYAVATGGGDVMLITFSGSTVQNTATFGVVDDSPIAVKFSQDNQYVAALCATSFGGLKGPAVDMLPLSNGQLGVSTSYPLPSNASGSVDCAFSPNGAYLAVANSSSNNVTIFGYSNGVLSGGTSYPLPSGSTKPYSLAFSPDGSYLATANYGSNDATIFNVSASGALNAGTSYTMPTASTAPSSVVFSPDGSILAIGNQAATVPGFVVTFAFSNGVLSGGKQYSLPDFLDSTPISVAFSPNGGYLISVNKGSDNLTIFSVGCSTTTVSTSGTGSASTGSSVTTGGATSVPTGSTTGVGTTISTGTTRGTTTIGSSTTGTSTGPVLDGKRAVAVALGILGLQALMG